MNGWLALPSYTLVGVDAVRGGGGLDWTLWWEAEPGRDLAEKMRAEDWVLSAARMAT